MPLFEIKKGKVTKVNKKEFTNEQALHKLIDQNLDEIFKIRYIKDEHITDKHGRIETLGIDEGGRPVVIEYKKTKEKGQMVQANRYITWIRQNPDSFELLVRKNIPNFKGKIDFTNPRIICFAQTYSIDDKCLALALGAELWKYIFYENDSLVISKEEEPEQLIKGKGTTPATIVKVTRIPKPAKTVEEHLQGASIELIACFNQFNELVMDISSEIERYTNAQEINYKTSVNFAAIAVQKKNNSLRVIFRTIQDQINDPKNLTTKVPKNYGWGNMTRILMINPELLKKKYSWNDIMDLIVQAYNTTQ